MSSVAPQVSTWEATLGVAIANIVELRLNDTKLKPDQCIAIFSALVESEKLTCLDLSDNSLSAVPPQLLASVLTRAREGYLRRGDLTPPQAVALLEASLAQDWPNFVELLEGLWGRSEHGAELEIKSWLFSVHSPHSSQLTTGNCRS